MAALDYGLKKKKKKKKGLSGAERHDHTGRSLQVKGSQDAKKLRKIGRG